MDLNSVGKLLSTISVHYPSFKKHIENSNGQISKSVAEEWKRLLGFMTYEEAISKLDAYLMLPDGNKYAPDVKYFLNSTGSGRRTVFHASTEHKWHLEFPKWDQERKHGMLCDEDDRRYTHDPMYEDGYYYNNMGQICTMDGRPVF